ncbi:uncharacterized protein [Triticum aestivum]|uniref:uncharacterized protein isoform X2 n=1 Tax=Triticum aestivum TaxID=4565 RepID=UPI00084572D0|nr:uncharacterized protein LOC123075854 isoform X2 [Triticum aestivum]
MPQKRRRRRRRSPREGPSRRRRGEEGASFSGSLVESDSSSTTSSAPPSGSLDEPPVTRPARQSRYHEILASRLARLQLQAGVVVAADDTPNLPSDEIVQVLARSNFYDDELRAALVEDQVHKFLSVPHGPDVGDTYFGEDSGDDITAEEFAKYSGQLKTRRPAEIDIKTGLNQEQLDSLLAKYKRYRFKAYLLLLGKPVDELEEAALESKYPMELALENDFFYPCHHDSAFGWYFDSDLCLLANLSDYQRLVLPNRGGNEYEYDRWSQYKSFYNTPDADREYVLYWEKMVKEMKWLENHVLKDFLEWEPMRRKGLYQSIKIANGFSNIHLGLACHGFEEYVLRTRLYRLFVEGLYRAFLEIWKRVNEGQTSFRDALQEVYNENPVPLRQHTLKAELECLHDSAFGWYFDSDLCLLANLSDYQRLVLPNSGGNEYEYDRWSQYKAFYNTPDADREYVLYWEKMVKEMKWLENHVLKDFLEWEPMRRKGLYQSIKIANGFTNIHLGLACHGFEEYVWRTRLYRLFVEGLDRAFLEIWKRVNQAQEVYNQNAVPLRQHTLKAELEQPGGFLQLERQFRRCTEGISKELPDRRVQELIAQEINYKRALPKTYAQYARKKLVGIIPRAEIPA